jgi:hypothetical protein
MVRCTETLLMRLFRVFIRAQSEFLFRCYSDPVECAEGRRAPLVRLALRENFPFVESSLTGVFRL